MSNMLMWNCFDMAHRPLHETFLLPEMPGIYVVYQDDQVLYVGETKNLSIRWRAHHLFPELYALGPDVAVAWQEMPGSDETVRTLYEQALIGFLRPVLNGKRHRQATDPESSLLRQKREAAGLTMTELAARVAMDLSKLSRLEHGHLQLKATDVVLLAHALGCRPEELLPPLTKEPANV